MLVKCLKHGMRGSIVSREMIIWVAMHGRWNAQASIKQMTKGEMNITKNTKQIAKELTPKIMQMTPH